MITETLGLQATAVTMSVWSGLAEMTTSLLGLVAAVAPYPYGKTLWGACV